MAYDAELLSKAAGLRSFYPADNQIGLAVDELIKDMVNGESRKEVRDDAKALLKEIGEGSSAHRIITEILETVSPKRKRKAKAKA